MRDRNRHRTPGGRRSLRMACLLTALGAGAMGASRPAVAQLNTNSALEFYRGEPSQLSAFTLSSWGSGKIQADTHSGFDTGTNSLRITTQGYYQGASIGFNTPIDLSAFVTNKNAFLQFVLLLSDQQNGRAGGFGQGGFGGGPGGFPGGGSSPGGFGGGAPGGFPGGGSSPGGFGGGAPGGFPGGAQGGFGGGAPGGFGRGGRGGLIGGGPAATQRAAALQNLRLVMVTTGGKELEMLVPLAYAVRATDEWRRLSIPVAGIPGLTADDGKIKELRIFGDSLATLHLGKLSVVTDTTPLKVEPLVGVKDIYQYTARASAGVTPLKYSWDWDASDGIQDESQGRTVRHTYFKPGDYTVTVTISDAFNVKPPVTTTFKVHVHP